MCLCRSIMCEKLLPAANNTGGSTCIAPSSTPSSSSAPCPCWFDDGGCGDADVDNKDFFNPLKHNNQTFTPSGRLCEDRYLYSTSKTLRLLRENYGEGGGQADV